MSDSDPLSEFEHDDPTMHMMEMLMMAKQSNSTQFYDDGN